MKEIEIIPANSKEIRSKNKKERLRVAAYCRVSTDSEDQLKSYHAQMSYYRNLIDRHEEWQLVSIYADEATTGTQVSKRESFQRLINDCLNNKIDMVITKSISRFARNTLDTLTYVRMLREKNIPIFFEEENIKTDAMAGELLLTILSSVSQQEVENISEHVRKGLLMKMQRGEIVGFSSCLGYEYIKETNTITIIEEEAKIVRFIFNLYVAGKGGYIIARELELNNYKTKRGGAKWSHSSVIDIIKNEKYSGDLLQGKSFTVDPISKRRYKNFGERDKFYIKNHHEAIIDRETFDKANELLNLRKKKCKQTGKRKKHSRKHDFSCMLECGFCGKHLIKRPWQSDEAAWHCMKANKEGKKYCPHCKAIPQTMIKKAFLESYRQLNINRHENKNELLKALEIGFSGTENKKQLDKINIEISKLKIKQNKLIDMKLEDIIDKDTFKTKDKELIDKLIALNNTKIKLEKSFHLLEEIPTKINKLEKFLEEDVILDEFNRNVFETTIQKVIVGRIHSGNVEPYYLSFIYREGTISNYDGIHFKNKTYF